MKQWSFTQASKNLQYQDGRYLRSLKRAENDLAEQENFQGLFIAFPELERAYRHCKEMIVELEENLLHEDLAANLQPIEDFKESVWGNLRRAYQAWQQSMRSAYVNDPRGVGVDLCIEFFEELAADIKRALDPDRENLLEDAR